MKLTHFTSILVIATMLIFSSAYAQHALQIDDGAGHISTIIAPATPSTFKLPTNTGTAGQVLTSNGAGGTSFQPAGSFTPSFLYEYAANTAGFGLFVLPVSIVPMLNLGTNTGTAFTVGAQGSIIINETGIYQVDFSISLANNILLPSFCLFKNGLQIPETQYTPMVGASIHGMAYLNLNVGDVLYLVNNTPAVAQIGGPTFLIGNVIASLRMSRVQ